MVGKNPNLDTLAAALALYLALLKAGKMAAIACPTEPLVEHSSLVGIDKVSQKLTGGGKDLVIALPYQKGRIEKISYNIEGNKIHLVVKAGSDGLGFDTGDINFLKTGEGNAGLLFLIGVTNPREELDSLYQEEMFREGQVLGIGTSGQGEFIDSTASSISEMLVDLLNKLAAPMDIDIAQNLMKGINFATDNFQSEKTSPLAFEMAALLLRHGAKREFGQKAPPQTFEKTFEIKEDKKDDKKEKIQAPSDWLTPKIYKGSTLP